MTQQNPKDTLQADLEALAEVFEAEEREDRRREAQRRRDGLPEPERDLHFRGLRGRWSGSSRLRCISSSVDSSLQFCQCSLSCWTPPIS